MKKYLCILTLLSLPVLASKEPTVENKAKPEKTALIFGVTGQDGSYLAEFLLEKGYAVHGVIRRASTINTGRIDHLYEGPQKQNRHFILHYGDLSDGANILELLRTIKPDEVYNLAAQSHVKVSFEMPEYTADIDGIGTLRILDGIKVLGLKNTRFYQASTSEMFGGMQKGVPQNEETAFYPRSPYGAAKLYAHWITKNYRESYDMYACSGILFNHESPRRGETFVTRKITLAVAAIANSLEENLYLGNLDSVRDWGHAKDYVEAIWLMLQKEKPEDLVIASGETHTVREFVELSFAYAGIAIGWKGKGVNEIGFDKKTGKELVFVDPRYFRPAEVEYLHGDSSRARKQLGWAQRHTFKQLVDDMMQHDMKDAKKRMFEKEAILAAEAKSKDESSLSKSDL